MADEDLVRILQEQRKSEQTIQNFSFDDEFKVSIVELAGYDVSTDTLKRVAVDSLGRLKVVVAGTATTTSILEYDDVTTIAANALTTILSYTVVGTALLVDQIIASGDVDAVYFLVVDGSIKAQYRTSEQDRTAKFNFPVAQKFSIGQVIDIKVIHYDTGDTSDFNATLIGHQ